MKRFGIAMLMVLAAIGSVGLGFGVASAAPDGTSIKSIQAP
jgi:hypothetical protein